MRRVRYGAIALAMAATGVYLFVYLYRWEWHRALVAGVLFVAAEVALVGAALLDRMRSIEARLDGAGPPAPERPPAEEALTRVREAAPPPRTDFDWLARQPGELSVFVPILLGAGVVLSGAAWVVERLARATARPAFEHGLALRLQPFSLPVGVLRGAAVAAAPSRRRPWARHALAAVASVAVATVGLDAVADATQNRPDPLRPGTASAVVVAIEGRPERPALAATRALWGACTTQLGRRHHVVGMTDLGGGRVRVGVRPEIGRHAERRLRGCIGDATTDQLRAGVVRID